MYGKKFSEGLTSYRDILTNYDQLQIWYKILGRFVELGEFFSNPLRKDPIPGCYLEREGIYIRLKDFGSSQFHRMNIFDAVMYTHNCDFPRAVELIKNGFQPVPAHQSILSTPHKKFIFRLSFEARNFENRDKIFWNRLNLSRCDIENEVFPTKAILRNSKKVPNKIVRYLTRGLCYTFPIEERKKIYIPKEIGKSIWFTDTKKKDRWEWLDGNEYLIITKSYIDGKLVKKAIDDVDVIVLQSERIIPEPELLRQWANTYKYIFVLYDLDSTGIKESIKLCNYANLKLDYEQYVPIHYPMYFMDLKIDDTKKLTIDKGFSFMQDTLYSILEETKLY